MAKIKAEQVAKVLSESRQVAMEQLQVTDRYRAGFLAACARITFELSKTLPEDVAVEFRKTIGF